MKYSFTLKQIIIKTNKSQIISLGKEDGKFTAPINFTDRVIIGTYGTYGISLYSIGFYHMPKSEYIHNLIFNSKLLLGLTIIRMKRKKEELDSLLISFQNKPNLISEYTLARSIKELPMILVKMIYSYF